MTKDFSLRINGPHLILSLIFLGLGLVVLALSAKIYMDYSSHDILITEGSGSHDPEFLSEDVLSMIDPSRDTSGHVFDVVVQKNLFSRDREEWKPALVSNDQTDAAPARTHRINPGDFKLYGITSFNNEKMALLYYQRFPESSRNRLVLEGEIVYHESNGGTEAYRVVSIGSDSVTLEAAGDSFNVWLFSHDMQSISTTESENISVVVGGIDRPELDAQVISGQTPIKDTPPGTVPGTGREGSVLEQASGERSETVEEPGSMTEQTQETVQEPDPVTEGSSLSSQDMDRMVEEGTMRRVDTPFGPVYRPVE